MSNCCYLCMFDTPWEQPQPVGPEKALLAARGGGWGLAWLRGALMASGDR
jgi:hypothetical protein